MQRLSSATNASMSSQDTTLRAKPGDDPTEDRGGDDMDDILSQYLPNPNTSAAADKANSQGRGCSMLGGEEEV
jgi:hypothetical protein